MSASRRRVMLGMAAACCLPGRVLAASSGVPADQAVLLLLRALAYDRNLHERSGAELAVGVLFSEDDGASSREGKALHRALRDLEGRSVDGLPLRGLRSPYEDAKVLRQWIRHEGISALVVTVPLGRLPGILAVTREEQAASMAPARDHVVAGVSLGVTLTGQRPRLLVNRAASRAEGLDLSAKLLRFAEIVD